MSIIRRIELFVAGCLVLAIIVLGAYNYTLHKQLASAQEDNQLNSGNAAAHKTAAREYKRVITEEKEAHEELERALDRNPDWADEPVPSDIADVLRERADAAQGVPR